MRTSSAAVPVAELAAAGLTLRTEEAVAIVQELMRQVAAGEAAGVPSAHVIRLSVDGRVSVEGPVAAEPCVTRAAQLLECLLQVGQTGPARVPGRLKLVLARALGTLDLPPFGSLCEFSVALERFAAPDPAAAVADVVARWREAAAQREVRDTPEPVPVASDRAHVERFAPLDDPTPQQQSPSQPLTISDIRRARRAAGLSLRDVSVRSGIPVALLRQLEWGYLVNWPAGAPGRSQLVRYAKAAGLDEQVVVSLFTPLAQQTTSLRALLASSRASDGPAAVALTERPLERADADGVPEVSRDRTRSRRRVWRPVAAALLLVLGGSAAWVAVTRDLPQVWHAPPSQRAEIVAPAGRESGERTVAPTHAAGDAGDAGPSPANVPEAAQTAPVVSAPAMRHVVAPADDSPPASDAAAAHRSAPVGAAVFQGGDAEARPAGTSGAGRSVLRVTRIVDDTADNGPVRPSPDGRYIAFDSDRHGERAVYVADADGRNVRRVSRDGFAAMPSWSPDGQRLAFVRADAARPEVWHVWALDYESGELRQITRHAQGRPQDASWFPGGDHLVYAMADRLIVHDLGTGRERAFAGPRSGVEVRSPVVSPDGRRVAFQLARDGTWLLEMASGSMRRVLDDPTAGEYAWSPDGTQLAYHSTRAGGWGVWVMAPR
jgi:cytoskeletal protein RodZ